ncbi:hypothetical protein DY000_02029448 [Brassica cretica]|uniref:Uncharacterized protein n=1 Tax=Brassica cretica TaxID=69181 RepID=A0ABQ7DF76_BRACR|nr:hypothetical protein DY000_02029448 [Brassica cretica]
MVVKKSVHFKWMQLERMITLNINHNLEFVREISVFDQRNPKHEAAINLQKMYKSFRTRKLLYFGELKRSCISFFDIEKHEIANSGGLDLGQEQLSLAKVCQRMERHKSLLYNTRLRLFDIDEGEEVNLVEKCPQLKLQQQCTNHIGPIAIPNGFSAQHIDSVVRWGEEGCLAVVLAWFDIDEGEEVNLVEKCPQLKLQQQCTNHIGPIAIPNGFSAQHIDSVVRWGEEGTFQHSSFLAGGATVAA